MKSFNGYKNCFVSKIYFYFKMESTLIQKKLIMNHKYVITLDGTNRTYYGTCQCPDLYLFSNVVKFEPIYTYIGLIVFSEKDHFIDTHEKMD